MTGKEVRCEPGGEDGWVLTATSVLVRFQEYFPIDERER